MSILLEYDLDWSFGTRAELGPAIVLAAITTPPTIDFNLVNDVELSFSIFEAADISEVPSGMVIIDSFMFIPVHLV